jgi:hypothetical protein
LMVRRKSTRTVGIMFNPVQAITPIPLPTTDRKRFLSITVIAVSITLTTETRPIGISRQPLIKATMEQATMLILDKPQTRIPALLLEEQSAAIKEQKSVQQSAQQSDPETRHIS